MKTFYLVRHARAVSSDVGVNDFKRSLTKRGRNDALAMSKRLREKGICPDLIISSPADRALETAHIFAKNLDYPIRKILLKDEIYDEDEETLREIIRRLDDVYDTVILFGHEPSLSQLANALLQDAEIELQATDVVGIFLKISGWKDIAEDSGTLLLFDFPVDTSKVYQKARKTIAGQITAAMENILGNIDADASKSLEKKVQKTGKRLAKKFINALQASKVERISEIRKQQRIDNLSEHESRD